MSAFGLSARPLSNGLPVQVKIGPVVFKIVQVSNPTAKNAEGEDVPVYGMINFKHAVITIDEDLNPAVKWQCYFHEVIHAMFETIGLAGGDGGPSEGEVDALAYIMLAYVLDNDLLAIDFPAPETPKKKRSSSVFPFPQTREKK